MERKKAAQRQRIVEVAMALFREQGVEATTMEQIAREVDIAKGTLYNYFPVKEAIISEFMKRSFSERNSDWVQRLGRLPDTRSRMVWVISELVRGISAHRDIFERYMVYRMQRMLSFQPDEDDQSGFYLLGQEIIGLGQESGELRRDAPAYIQREMFDFAFIEVVKLLFADPEGFKAEEAVSMCVDLCLHGIKK
ncbi:MAG: TetR/AcrR family transcriptional regulator [Firmicutes bacterium]|nr:TetR/AcrR family transcriptional regulator [Bacillota bacterium]